MRHIEVLNSLIMKTMANENNINDILQTFHNYCCVTVIIITALQNFAVAK